MSEDALRARVIHFSDFVPEGPGFVMDLPDLREPPKAVIRDGACFLEWPLIPTLLVNPKSMGLVSLRKEVP